MRFLAPLRNDTANAEPDGKFHAIRVEIKQPSLTVRGRSGYYAVPRGLETLQPNEAQLMMAGRAASSGPRLCSSRTGVPLDVLFGQVTTTYHPPHSA